MTPTLLVVEDDHAVRTFLADNLSADGYEPATAATLREGLIRLAARPAPLLAIVDVGLPDGSGLELILRARAGQGGLPPGIRLLALSGDAGELERVRALRVGADDFLAKPFSYPELLLRVRSLLRRGPDGVDRQPVLAAGGLEVDASTRTVRLHGEPVEVSAKEFALLHTLAVDPVRVHTKTELLREVWGYTLPATTRTLDSHACRLRRKLGVAGDRYVVNVWGVGYKLTEEVAA